MIGTKQTSNVVKFLRELTSTEGHPSLIQSDNGREFVNKCVKGWCLWLISFNFYFIQSAWLNESTDLHGKALTTHVKGRPYHPEANGQVERTIKTLINQMKSQVPSSQNYSYSAWCARMTDILRLSTTAYNNSSE